MRARRVLLRVVSSGRYSGFVSLKPLAGKGGLRRELTTAGYKPGDVVALELAGGEVDEVGLATKVVSR